ncbi:MAG: M23 family metallopeptidase [Halofilum sp. (in: g-proteobacteria)]
MSRSRLRRSLAVTLLLALTAAPLHASEVPLELDGAFEQGALVVGHTDPKARVQFQGDPVRVSTEGVFLIGFGRDAEKTATLVAEAPDGTRRERELTVSPRDYHIQRIEGVERDKVTPPESVWDRIREEARQVGKARRTDDPRTDFLAEFQWPIEGPITGEYGSQRFYNGEPRRPHYGIDIAAPAGTVVRAPAGGVVTLAHPDMYFSGGTLLLDHGHGLSSAFLHMSKLDVEVGDEVAQGDRLGEVGSTGRSTGAHLDWRINLFSRRLDPTYLVGDMPEPARASAE